MDASKGTVEGEREMIPRAERFRAGQRRRSRGLTLVELIVVITIIGSLMGIIAFAIFARKKQADIQTAKLACTQYRQTVLTYKQVHTDVDCVQPDQLKSEKEIDSTTSIKDPWGSVFKVVCDGEEIAVISFGPDKKEGTDDDIRVPPLDKGK
jgi:general secretion pathway protein G